MTEIQIIERLILEIECIAEEHLIEEDTKEFVSRLKKTGQYYSYPIYPFQTQDDRDRMKNLLTLVP
jgi:hypothetical protein